MAPIKIVADRGADGGPRQRLAGRGWIKESYNRAIAKASDDDRALALQMLEHWLQGKKD